MDALKDVLSLVAAIVGLLTALVPLVARLVDKKKSATLKDPARAGERRQVAVSTIPQVLPLDGEDEPCLDPKQARNAQALVKAPAIALMVTGFLGIGFNLFMACVGVVDTFITPLSSDQPSPRYAAAWDSGLKAETDKPQADREHDRLGAIVAIPMMLSFALASAMAIWAGFNMSKLRSYWLSVAGSFAIMPGGCFCCLAGFPIGIWALVVLLKPEVSSSFR
jgi:hypothetical protein